MRHVIPALLLVLAGCAAEPKEPLFPPPPPPTTVLQEEVDLAASLPFERDRRERLRAVAMQPNLDAPTQVRVVNAAYRTLPDDEDLEVVLMAIIQNESFTPAARDAIRAGLNDQTTFPDTQARLHAAIARRGKLGE